MPRLIGLGLAGLLAVATFAGSAAAAYTSPTLAVASAGAKTTVTVRQSPTDDSTARAVIYAPPGTSATLTQAPGATLGTVDAEVAALALNGAELQLAGDIRVAAAGQVAAALQLACTGTTTHTATWLMVLTAVGQTLTIPMYVDTATGGETAFASTKIQVCLPPPDVPQDQGGAPFGAKVLQAAFTLNGVLGRGAGTWRTLWTPYVAGNGQPNAAGSVEARSTVAPGVLTARAARAGARVRVTGRLAAGGRAVAGAAVQVWGGAKRTGLKKLATVRTSASGAFTHTRLRGTLTFFQVRTAVAARPDATGCSAAGPLGAPCVTATRSGFTAASAVSRLR
jgi:hypothetical protein